MKVSVSGYYAWRKRLTKPPSVRRKSLKQLVKNCYWENRKRYGSRRIKADLQKAGIKIGRFAVRKLMSEEGLKAIQPKSFKPKVFSQDSKQNCWKTESLKMQAKQNRKSSATSKDIIIGVG